MKQSKTLRFVVNWLFTPFWLRQKRAPENKHTTCFDVLLYHCYGCDIHINDDLFIVLITNLMGFQLKHIVRHESIMRNVRNVCTADEVPNQFS